MRIVIKNTENIEKDFTFEAILALFYLHSFGISTISMWGMNVRPIFKK